MKSKYYNRAKEILQNYPVPKGDMYEEDAIKAMCQLAEEVENNNYPKNAYYIVTWSESQVFMEEDWFDECFLINDDVGLEMFGSGAYFIPVDRYNEFYDIIKSPLYTKQQVEELLQKQRKLCAEKAEIEPNKYIGKLTVNETYFKINENSILNTKLNIDKL